MARWSAVFNTTLVQAFVVAFIISGLFELCYAYSFVQCYSYCLGYPDLSSFGGLSGCVCWSMKI